MRSAEIHTRIIDESLTPQPRELPAAQINALAAAAMSAVGMTGDGVWDGWGSALPSSWPVYLSLNTDGFNLTAATGSQETDSDTDEASPYPQIWHVTQCGANHMSAIAEVSSSESATTSFEFKDLCYQKTENVLNFTLNGHAQSWPAHFAETQHEVTLHLQTPHGDQLRYTDQTYTRSSHDDQGEGDGRILAPMSGKVLAVHCEVGQSVSRGDTLLILEAMKLEHAIVASASGVVAEVCTASGDQVTPKQQLVTIEVTTPST